MRHRPLIYMDHAATTRTDPRVVEAMLPYFLQRYGNAASRSHPLGWEAARAVDIARRQAADLLGASPREIVWTSGATESNNLAIKGAARMLARAPAGSPDRGHILTAVHEHKSVLDTCKRLEREGFEITKLAPGPDGLITAEMVLRAIRPDTLLVSIMWANNELGTVNEIPGIGEVCRDRGVLLHTDATQWVGKMPTDVVRDHVDLLSFSGHKLYGPNGVGVLYVRRRGDAVRLEAIIDGGGHEHGMRSGTLNVPGIVGLGAACEICTSELASEGARLRSLRMRLERSLRSSMADVQINGHPDRRLPHITSVSFGGLKGGSLLGRLGGIACSSGSACNSASQKPSYVLGALGVDDDLARATLRLSLGRWTTAGDVDHAAAQIREAVELIRGVERHRAAPAEAAEVRMISSGIR